MRSCDIVGTPTKLVTFSRSMSCNARNGSHLCIITSFAPVATDPSITGTQPVTWNNGTVRMKQGGTGAGVVAGSGGVSGAQRIASTVVMHANANSPESTPRFVETAPLGTPVVPEVKRMVASSSVATSTAGIGAPGVTTSARWSQPAGSSPSARMTNPWMLSAASRSPIRSTSSRSVMRTFAPASTRPNSISGPVHQALT